LRNNCAFVDHSTK